MTDQDQGPEESFVHLTPKGPDDAADTQADLDAGATGTMTSATLPDLIGPAVAAYRAGRRD